MTDLLAARLAALGLDSTLAAYAVDLAILLLALTLAFAADLIAKRYLLRLVRRLAQKTETPWDDVLVRTRTFDRLAHLAPVFVLRRFAGAGFLLPEPLVVSLTGALATIIAVGVFLSVLDAAHEIYGGYPISKEVPIGAYVQGLRGIAILLACVFVLSTLMQGDPWAFIKGLGALTAVLLLIFKDTILGLVGSIQLTANKMVRIGDWVEMKKYGADGDVVEVGLSSVKVQNWNKTITTIPTYTMITDAFRNWRGMSESGGRRIKRAIYIDMNSVRFCTHELLDRLQRIELLGDYLGERRAEVEQHNERLECDPSLPANGRRLTNLGTFRAYLQAYLRAHPMINKKMTFLIRQLPPSEKGVGIEIYVFSADQDWVRYEAIQSDIMDHMLAVIGEFELRVFQSPSGADFRSLTTPR